MQVAKIEIVCVQFFFSIKGVILNININMDKSGKLLPQGNTSHTATRSSSETKENCRVGESCGAEG